jgi:WhiB family redox-sensing transcriptional regulator
VTATHGRFVATDTHWMTAAACRGAPADVFFVERGASVRPAKAICARCPVAAECLDYAVEHRIKEGIWGGHDERQRRRLYRLVPRAPRAEAPHGTARRYRGGCRCDTCRRENSRYVRRQREETANG